MKKNIVPLLIALVMVVTAVPLGSVDAYAAGKANIKDATITISKLTYNGKAQTPAIKVMYGQKTLVENVDYKVTCNKGQPAIDAKGYNVVIEGLGDYKGKTNQHFTIDPKKIIPAVTLSAKSFVYNGDVRKPTVKKVMDSTKTLAASDYTVTYSAGCKDVGKYGVKVTMKGNYAGTKKVYFKINPKGTSIKSLTRGSKKIKVKWKAQSTLMSKSRITGYQIKLATNSKFTKNKKVVTVKGYSKVSKKVTKLKGKKRYYVRIRTYKTVSGVKYYSKWSKTRSIVTKR